MSYTSISNNDYRYVFEELMDISDDGFIVVDINGIVVNVNENYACFLGKPKDHIIGKHVSETIRNTEMVSIQKYDRRDIHFISVVDQTEITPESKDRVLCVNRSPIKNASNEIIGSVAQVKFRKETNYNSKILNEAYKTLSIYDKEILDKIESENQLSTEIDIVKKLRLQIEYYKNELREIREAKLDNLVGTSSNFLRVKYEATRAGKNSFSVLLTGETGTGKEIIANLIHSVSDRSEKPFIKINCAAIPEELFESELFGYESGAFTGAQKGGKIGKFTAAHKGTLFLDEIGDLPLNMQAKLLRVLQDGLVEPLGSIKPLKVNVRIISATNIDLMKLIETNKFRLDLFYRLNEVTIKIPKLLDRQSDIKPLAQYMLNKLNWQYGTSFTFSPDIFNFLQNYNWPGNIRELNNVIKNAYSRLEEGTNTIEISHLPDYITSESKIYSFSSTTKTLKKYLDMHEKTFIISSLKEYNYDIMKTSTVLGINKSNLYKKINKYNILIKSKRQINRHLEP